MVSDLLQAPSKRFCSILQRLVSLTDAEQELIRSIVVVKSVKKRQFLLREGEYCNEYYFVSEGLLRNVTINKEGNEITTYFAADNTFIVDYTSFMLKTPCLFSIQALEDSTVVILDRNAIGTIHDRVYNGNKLGRLLAESQFIRFIQHHNYAYRHSIWERYQALSESIPRIHSRVPQHMIASYLGITRVHLSRLKKVQLTDSR